MAANDDDDVGYGKPPKAHRFQKGRSGNPRGRPPKRSVLAEPAIQRVLRQKMSVVMDGRAKKVTIAQGLVFRMVEEAGKGRIGALRYLVTANEKLEQAAAQTPSVPIQQGPSIPQLVDMMEVVECLLAAGVVYMRNGGAFVFERSKMESFITGNPGFMARASDLTYLIGCRAEDPDAMAFGEEETLLDVIGRLSGGAN